MLADIPVMMPSRQKVPDEVADWFGSCYEKLKVTGVSNLSTNAALLVQADKRTKIVAHATFLWYSISIKEESNYGG